MVKQLKQWHLWLFQRVYDNPRDLIFKSFGQIFRTLLFLSVGLAVFSCII